MVEEEELGELELELELELEQQERKTIGQHLLVFFLQLSFFWF